MQIHLLTQEIIQNLQVLMDHYRVHNSRSLIPVIRQMSAVTRTSYLLSKNYDLF
jgi:hypothetical protein